MEQSTYKFTIFLMKEYVKEYENCIKDDKEVIYHNIKEEMDIDGVIVTAKSSVNRPDWLVFLENFSASTIDMRENVSNKALMLVKIKNIFVF